MSKIGRYLLNFAVLLDEAVNTIFGGSPNETISERAAKARNAGRRWGCVLCRFLDTISKGHCDDALTSTIGDDAVIPDGE
ncbi:hypothetical protein NCF_04377 [Burkholderia pseudomallei]|uniref:hypothetical protein n=1 Tax=Burkholderia pseudomallei TaxID=28450 RepID=UPI00052AF251|nr:hypothetical protein [Burkholderia pseudomallei]AIV86485.1 hypothetical protein X995_5113 [Burkholderia pseudomallei B03]AIV92346.1 hypothetical protein X996_5975 [Burkholderia pseudomallei A79A]KGW27270.1 hypothetical protein Y602_1924 [Burkholderia pseudomallei MSHR733]KGX47207.1 hypothetical protein Y043_5552 [Burkholderia pseudomallei MSHR2138]KGX47499.1 hypothetical protein Y600_5899 [Burkholderia pseudomallei MSHR3709]